MQKQIRNFSIIAHIDHGKSTLADRLLEYTGAISRREARDQFLDNMDLERERGITIKAHTVRLTYKARNGSEHILNLLDTPGHVDFTYEVSRSLAACEGALLVVDASQGVEAQTIANFHLAQQNNLLIIPIINKIDLPSADIEKVTAQMKETLGINPHDILLASAKEGIGTEEILEAIVSRIPPPAGDPDRRLRALIVDSWFDTYHGVIVLIRVVDGRVRVGQKIRLMMTDKLCDVVGVGVFSPKMQQVEELCAGEVGYLMAGIRKVSDSRIGDTITEADRPAEHPLPGYRDVKPMVFCGLYPVETHRFEELREALGKLRLNDSAFTYEPETSLALGFGFRCGFLGLLHMDIVKERLEREYHLELIGTAPTVVYRVRTKKGEEVTVDNPTKMPPAHQISSLAEPYIRALIITPEEFLGAILRLCQERRGKQKDLRYLDLNRVMLMYELPFNEVVIDFYDRLKSLSRGYASFDYEFIGEREADLVKVDILVNSEGVDSLSFIIHRDKAAERARKAVTLMRELIPRQLFEVVIQAAIGGRVIARESKSPLRKDVTAKCYGGDITRKRKLWEKQKEGKRKMKQLGRVEIPQEVFLTALKLTD